MKMRHRFLLVVTCIVAVAALFSRAGERSSRMPSFSEIRNPAAPGSLAPNLSATPDGEVLLSWL
jgi:hypothetical protein